MGLWNAICYLSEREIIRVKHEKLQQHIIKN